MEQNNKKIIISVKVNEVDLTSLAAYSPLGGIKHFEVYKSLLKNYSEIFTNNIFKSFLKSIIFEYDGDKEKIFTTTDDFKFDTVFENENFNTYWIINDDNKEIFIQNLIDTKDKHLIWKHNTEEIYVVPVLNEEFNNENVKYTEALINALKRDDEDLWLLLHDKDLYKYNESYHPANISDFPEEQHEVYSCPCLKALIEKNKVFTFIHQSSDSFFSDVINKLNVLNLDDIIIELESSHKLIFFTQKIATCMKKSDMVEKIKAGNSFDFSKQFLGL